MSKPNTWNSKINPSELRVAQAWWLLATALAAALVLGWGTVNAIWLLGYPIALFVLGLTLAAALRPLVRLFEQRLPHLLAIVLVYVILALLAGGILWAVLPTMATQLEGIPNRMPEITARARQMLSNWSGGLLGDSFTKAFGAQLKGMMGEQTLGKLPFTITTKVLDLLVVLFVSVYALLGSPGMKDFVLSLFPEAQRERTEAIVRSMGEAMGGYVRGVVLNGIIVGILTFLGLLALQVDFALFLGVMAGILELIPVVGPIVAGAIIVGLTLLQSPTKAVEALLFMIVMQQLENHILVPNIMRSQTNVSPLLSILALLAGATLGGLVGAVIAIPIAAALTVLVREVVAPAIRKQTGAEPVETAAK